jgi:hypothetical protein
MNKPKNNLPSHARLAFKGIMNEVWQWDQKMYDGTTKIFEKIKKQDTVTIIALV